MGHDSCAPLRLILPPRGCADAVSLCDLHAKYADIIGIEEALRFLDTLPSGLFDLPSGKPPQSRAKAEA